MKILFLLPGIVFGAAEFLMTKAIAERVLAGKPMAILLTVKLVSYAALLVPVVLVPDPMWLVPFGIGLSIGLPGFAFVYMLYNRIKGKR